MILCPSNQCSFLDICVLKINRATITSAAHPSQSFTRSSVHWNQPQNFFHIALTGTLGFAFCRFLYTPRAEWNRFLATYILVIVVHGAYDFLFGHSSGVADWYPPLCVGFDMRRHVDRHDA